MSETPPEVIPEIAPELTPEVAGALERFANADAIWYASTRPNGKPHLAPIWHVWADDAAWVCTDNTTVRAHNLATSSAVSLSLADTASPVIIEGLAAANDEPTETVLTEFKRKYDWDITNYANRCLIRIEPHKLMLWKVGSEAAMRWRFRDNRWHSV